MGLLCLIVGISLGSSKRALFTIGSLALLSLLFILFVRLVKETGDKTLFYFVVAALILRIATAVVLHYVFNLEGADALIYHAEASRLSLAFLGTGSSCKTGVAGFGYVYFSSFIYAGIGVSSLYLKLINCFVGVACGVYVYKFAMNIWKDNKVSLIAAFLALFMPGIGIWSTQNAKDPWVNLFILIALWQLILLRERGIKANYLIIVAVCIGALWTTRFYASLMIAPLLLYAMGAGRRKS